MEKQSRRRRRPALSCQECRRRKIKCDHNDPCSHCLRHTTKCIYTSYSHDNRDVSASGQSKRAFLEARTSRPGPEILREQAVIVGPGVGPSSEEASAQEPTPATTDSIFNPNRLITENHRDDCGHVAWVDTATQAVHIHRPHATVQPPIDHIDSQAVQFLPGHVQSAKQDCSVAELIQRIQKLEESSASRAEASSSDYPPRLVLNKSRDLGKSQWMGMAHEFSVIIACYGEIIGKDSKDASYKTPETALLVAQSGDFIQKCKNTAKNIKVSRPSRSHASSPEIRPSSRDVSDDMVDLYFASFESTHRILHGPTFRAEYQQYWDHPDRAKTETRLKILLVIGLGSSLHDHQTTEKTLSNAELVQQWIYAAQNWLSGPLEKDRLSISGLQVYCLTILARQIFSVGGGLIWISTGSLVQRAMQMGLYRDPKHLPAMTPLQAELRRRLWTTVLELVVQSSLDSWMPPRISFDEFDVDPPSNVNDEDLDESTTVIEPHPQSTFTATSIQLTLLASLPVRLRIVQHMNSLHSEPSYHRVLELSTELTEALHARASTTKHNNEHCTPFRRNLLDYLVRRFVIPLHISFSSQARANAAYHYSRKASLDAAVAITSPEPDARFARLMAVGGGMFSEGLRLALTAVSLELLAHAEAQRLDGTLDRARAYRDMLKQAVRDLIVLSEERIRLGETNVKSHMFLCMTLAQVEAVEAGVPVELQVARGARDSLELCHGILSARARDAPVSLASPADAGCAAAGVDGDQGDDDFNMFGLGMNVDWDSIMSDVGLS